MKTFDFKEFNKNQFDIPQSVVLSFDRFSEDYLHRTTILNINNGNYSLKISPFPYCCGIRVLNNENYFSQSKIIQENKDFWVRFMLSLDNFYCRPGRYMAAFPGNSVEDGWLPNGCYQYSTLFNLTENFSDKERRSETFNPVMDSTIQTREFILPQKRRSGQSYFQYLQQIPMFEPYSDLFAQIFKEYKITSF